jgi:DNA-binding transcriptional LysR family regulator
VELRQLEHFVAVAEEGRFNRAADRCHIVRSGLSASIRSLETELGARLFVRTTHEVRLTDAGTAFLDEARRALAAADAAREAVRGVGGLLRGALTVAVGTATGAVDVPALLGRFHAAHPAVAISVVRAASNEVPDRLRTGAVDVALSYVVAPPPQGVCVEVLASGPMVLACAYDHPLASCASVTVRDLQHETFITVPMTATTVEAALAAAGMARRSRIEVGHYDLFLDLVRVGLGVALYPGPDAGGRASELVRRGAADHAAGGRWPPVCYVPIDDAPRWTYGLMAPQPEARTAAARAFIGLVHDARA